MSSRRTNSASLQAFRFKAPMPAVRAAATVMDNRFPNMYSENLVVCTFKISESRLVTKGEQGVRDVRWVSLPEPKVVPSPPTQA